MALPMPDFPTTDLLLIIRVGREQLIVVVVKFFWCAVPEASIAMASLVTTTLGGVNWTKLAGAFDPTTPHIIDLRCATAWRL
jgi:hypothetical protein